MMSRFPKLTETFVLDEILEMERSGITVEIFPLWREPERGAMHPEARQLVDRAHFYPTINGRILIDNLKSLLSQPGRYLATMLTLGRANLRSPRLLLGAIAVFPKAVSISHEMRRLGVRHVHAHFATHPAAAAYVIGRLAGISWSFTAHGSDLHRDQAMLKEKLEHAAFAVTISDYNKRFMLDHTCQDYAGKVHVIHCGVAVEKQPAAVPAGQPLQIVCVGTLHAVKGQLYLLRACALLQEEGLAFTCHLVGDGPDRGMLEREAARLGITQSVVFHGACVREKVRELLAGMTVAVAPSVPTADGRREGIPVALMESAAAGLPLVGSRLSGIPELVRDGETGLLVEPGDVSRLATALRRLATSSELAQGLGAAARNLVVSEFNLPANVARLRGLMLPGSAQ